MTDPGAPRSPWWLAARLFDEPRRVFESLAVRPRAALPIALLIVVSAAGAYGPPADVLREAARRQALALRARSPDQVGETEIRQMIERAAAPGTRSLVFSANVVFGLLILTVVSLVLLLIFGATASEPVRFRDEFAIAAHANLPQLAGVLLTVGLMHAGLEGFDTPGHNPLSLGFLFDEARHPFLHRLAEQLTLFGAWNVYLLARGNQVKTRAPRLRGPLAVVVSLWIMASVGLAAVAGLFAPAA